MGFPLDLSDADISGFDPIPAARYEAEVFETSMDATTNPNGNLPVGTPIVKVTFRITEGEFENRRVWGQYFLPGTDYDEKKRKTMLGMYVNFLMALGYDEAQVRSAAPELDELVGLKCVVVVGKEPKKTRDLEVIEGEFNNPVKGVKPAGSTTAGSTAEGSLL